MSDLRPTTEGGKLRWQVQGEVLGSEAARQMLADGWEPIASYYVPLNEHGYGGWPVIVLRIQYEIEDDE